MLNAASPPRDPAALPRLLLTLAALLLLWPGLRLSELDIPGLFSGDNARTMGGFLAGFWPPAHDPGFLALLGRATLETLAIATAGMALAWLLAFPAALLATRALSLSALPRGGLPAWWARALRWPVRGLLILLRSVPEIVWALLFVRAVGWGPPPGCWPSPSPMPACSARSTRKSSSRWIRAPPAPCCWAADRGWRRSPTGCCRTPPGK